MSQCTKNKQAESFILIMQSIQLKRNDIKEKK